MLNLQKFIFILIVSQLFITSSCVSKKKINYFQDKSSADTTAVKSTLSNYTPVFQKDDFLSISVAAMDLESIKPFSLANGITATGSQSPSYTSGIAASNGYLIDGPVLDMKYKSGIGMFPIPMSHGLTVGEFAQMANGQGWLKDGVKANIKIIPVANYNHDMPYELPVPPSPNLNTQQSILLYPSLCMFEGTYINLGRGTFFPFTVLGSPYLKGIYDFSFTPTGIKGMAETPLFMNQVCYGLDLRTYDTELLRKSKQINFKWIMELYKASPNKEQFFDSKMSKEMNNIEIQIGSGLFRQQIIDGVPEAEIRAGWEAGLNEYKEMRKKYLLYP